MLMVRYNGFQIQIMGVINKIHEHAAIIYIRKYINMKRACRRDVLSLPCRLVPCMSLVAPRLELGGPEGQDPRRQVRRRPDRRLAEQSILGMLLVVGRAIPPPLFASLTASPWLVNILLLTSVFRAMWLPLSVFQLTTGLVVLFMLRMHPLYILSSTQLVQFI